MNSHNIQQYVNVVFSAKGQQQVLQYAEQMLKASKEERKQVLDSIKAIEEKGEALTKDEQEELKRLKKLKEALNVQVQTYETAKTKGVEAFNALTKGLTQMENLGTRSLNQLNKKLRSLVNSIGDLYDEAGNINEGRAKQLEAVVNGISETSARLDMQQHGVISFNKKLGSSANNKALENHIQMFDKYARYLKKSDEEYQIWGQNVLKMRVQLAKNNGKMGTLSAGMSAQELVDTVKSWREISAWADKAGISISHVWKETDAVNVLSDKFAHKNAFLNFSDKEIEDMVSLMKSLGKESALTAVQQQKLSNAIFNGESIQSSRKNMEEFRKVELSLGEGYSKLNTESSEWLDGQASRLKKVMKLTEQGSKEYEEMASILARIESASDNRKETERIRAIEGESAAAAREAANARATQKNIEESLAKNILEQKAAREAEIKADEKILALEEKRASLRAKREKIEDDMAKEYGSLRSEESEFLSQNVNAKRYKAIAQQQARRQREAAEADLAPIEEPEPEITDKKSKLGEQRKELGDLMDALRGTVALYNYNADLHKQSRLTTEKQTQAEIKAATDSAEAVEKSEARKQKARKNTQKVVADATTDSAPQVNLSVSREELTQSKTDKNLVASLAGALKNSGVFPAEATMQTYADMFKHVYSADIKKLAAGIRYEGADREPQFQEEEHQLLQRLYTDYMNLGSEADIVGEKIETASQQGTKATDQLSHGIKEMSDTLKNSLKQLVDDFLSITDAVGDPNDELAVKVRELLQSVGDAYLAEMGTESAIIRDMRDAFEKELGLDSSKVNFEEPWIKNMQNALKSQDIFAASPAPSAPTAPEKTLKSAQKELSELRNESEDIFGSMTEQAGKFADSVTDWVPALTNGAKEVKAEFDEVSLFLRQLFRATNQVRLAAGSIENRTLVRAQKSDGRSYSMFDGVERQLTDSETEYDKYGKEIPYNRAVTMPGRFKMATRPELAMEAFDPWLDMIDAAPEKIQPLLDKLYEIQERFGEDPVQLSQMGFNDLQSMISLLEDMKSSINDLYTDHGDKSVIDDFGASLDAMRDIYKGFREEVIGYAGFSFVNDETLQLKSELQEFEEAYKEFLSAVESGDAAKIDETRGKVLLLGEDIKSFVSSGALKVSDLVDYGQSEKAQADKKLTEFKTDLKNSVADIKTIAKSSDTDFVSQFIYDEEETVNGKSRIKTINSLGTALPKKLEALYSHYTELSQKALTADSEAKFETTKEALKSLYAETDDVVKRFNDRIRKMQDDYDSQVKGRIKIVNQAKGELTKQVKEWDATFKENGANILNNVAPENAQYTIKKAYDFIAGKQDRGEIVSQRDIDLMNLYAKALRSLEEPVRKFETAENRLAERRQENAYLLTQIEAATAERDRLASLSRVDLNIDFADLTAARKASNAAARAELAEVKQRITEGVSEIEKTVAEPLGDRIADKVFDTLTKTTQTALNKANELVKKSFGEDGQLVDLSQAENMETYLRTVVQATSVVNRLQTEINAIDKNIAKGKIKPENLADAVSSRANLVAEQRYWQQFTGDRDSLGRIDASGITFEAGSRAEATKLALDAAMQALDESAENAWKKSKMRREKIREAFALTPTAEEETQANQIWDSFVASNYQEMDDATKEMIAGSEYLTDFMTSKLRELLSKQNADVREITRAQENNNMFAQYTEQNWDALHEAQENAKEQLKFFENLEEYLLKNAVGRSLNGNKGLTEEQIRKQAPKFKQMYLNLVNMTNSAEYAGNLAFRQMVDNEMKRMRDGIEDMIERYQTGAKETANNLSTRFFNQTYRGANGQETQSVFTTSKTFNNRTADYDSRAFATLRSEDNYGAEAINAAFEQMNATVPTTLSLFRQFAEARDKALGKRYTEQNLFFDRGAQAANLNFYSLLKTLPSLRAELEAFKPEEGPAQMVNHTADSTARLIELMHKAGIEVDEFTSPKEWNAANDAIRKLLENVETFLKDAKVLRSSIVGAENIQTLGKLNTQIATANKEDRITYYGRKLALLESIIEKTGIMAATEQDAAKTLGGFSTSATKKVSSALDEMDSLEEKQAKALARKGVYNRALNEEGDIDSAKFDALKKEENKRIERLQRQNDMLEEQNKRIEKQITLYQKSNTTQDTSSTSKPDKATSKTGRLAESLLEDVSLRKERTEIKLGDIRERLSMYGNPGKEAMRDVNWQYANGGGTVDEMLEAIYTNPNKRFDGAFNTDFWMDRGNGKWEIISDEDVNEAKRKLREVWSEEQQRLDEERKANLQAIISAGELAKMSKEEQAKILAPTDMQNRFGQWMENFRKAYDGGIVNGEGKSMKDIFGESKKNITWLNELESQLNTIFGSERYHSDTDYQQMVDKWLEDNIFGKRAGTLTSRFNTLVERMTAPEQSGALQRRAVGTFVKSSDMRTGLDKLIDGRTISLTQATQMLADGKVEEAKQSLAAMNVDYENRIKPYYDEYERLLARRNQVLELRLSNRDFSYSQQKEGEYRKRLTGYEASGVRMALYAVNPNSKISQQILSNDTIAEFARMTEVAGGGEALENLQDSVIQVLAGYEQFFQSEKKFGLGTSQTKMNALLKRNDFKNDDALAALRKAFGKGGDINEALKQSNFTPEAVRQAVMNIQIPEGEKYEPLRNVRDAMVESVDKMMDKVTEMKTTLGQQWGDIRTLVASNAGLTTFSGAIDHISDSIDNLENMSLKDVQKNMTDLVKGINPYGTVGEVRDVAVRALREMGIDVEKSMKESAKSALHTFVDTLNAEGVNLDASGMENLKQNINTVFERANSKDTMLGVGGVKKNMNEIYDYIKLIFGKNIPETVKEAWSKVSETVSAKNLNVDDDSINAVTDTFGDTAGELTDKLLTIINTTKELSDNTPFVNYEQQVMRSTKRVTQMFGEEAAARANARGREKAETEQEAKDANRAATRYTDPARMAPDDKTLAQIDKYKQKIVELRKALELHESNMGNDKELRENKWRIDWRTRSDYERQIRSYEMRIEDLEDSTFRRNVSPNRTLSQYTSTFNAGVKAIAGDNHAVMNANELAEIQGYQKATKELFNALGDADSFYQQLDDRGRASLDRLIQWQVGSVNAMRNALAKAIHTGDKEGIQKAMNEYKQSMRDLQSFMVNVHKELDKQSEMTVAVTENQWKSSVQWLKNFTSRNTDIEVNGQQINRGQNASELGKARNTLNQRYIHEQSQNEMWGAEGMNLGISADKMQQRAASIKSITDGLVDYLSKQGADMSGWGATFLINDQDVAKFEAKVRNVQNFIHNFLSSEDFKQLQETNPERATSIMRVLTSALNDVEKVGYTETVKKNGDVERTFTKMGETSGYLTKSLQNLFVAMRSGHPEEVQKAWDAANESLSSLGKQAHILAGKGAFTDVSDAEFEAAKTTIASLEDTNDKVREAYEERLQIVRRFYYQVTGMTPRQDQLQTLLEFTPKGYENELKTLAETLEKNRATIAQNKEDIAARRNLSVEDFNQTKSTLIEVGKKIKSNKDIIANNQEIVDALKNGIIQATILEEKRDTLQKKITEGTSENIEADKQALAATEADLQTLNEHIDNLADKSAALKTVTDALRESLGKKADEYDSIVEEEKRADEELEKARNEGQAAHDRRSQIEQSIADEKLRLEATKRNIEEMDKLAASGKGVDWTKYSDEQMEKFIKDTEEQMKQLNRNTRKGAEEYNRNLELITTARRNLNARRGDIRDDETLIQMNRELRNARRQVDAKKAAGKDATLADVASRDQINSWLKYWEAQLNGLDQTDKKYKTVLKTVNELRTAQTTQDVAKGEEERLRIINALANGQKVSNEELRKALDLTQKRLAIEWDYNKKNVKDQSYSARKLRSEYIAMGVEDATRSYGNAMAANEHEFRNLKNLTIEDIDVLIKKYQDAASAANQWGIDTTAVVGKIEKLEAARNAKKEQNRADIMANLSNYDLKDVQSAVKMTEDLARKEKAVNGETLAWKDYMAEIQKAYEYIHSVDLKDKTSKYNEQLGNLGQMMALARGGHMDAQQLKQLEGQMKSLVLQGKALNQDTAELEQNLEEVSGILESRLINDFRELRQKALNDEGNIDIRKVQGMSDEDVRNLRSGLNERINQAASRGDEQALAKFSEELRELDKAAKDIASSKELYRIMAIINNPDGMGDATLKQTIQDFERLKAVLQDAGKWTQDLEDKLEALKLDDSTRKGNNLEERFNRIKTLDVTKETLQNLIHEMKAYNAELEASGRGTARFKNEIEQLTAKMQAQESTSLSTRYANRDKMGMQGLQMLINDMKRMRAEMEQTGKYTGQFDGMLKDLEERLDNVSRSAQEDKLADRYLAVLTSGMSLEGMEKLLSDLKQYDTMIETSGKGTAKFTSKIADLQEQIKMKKADDARTKGEADMDAFTFDGNNRLTDFDRTDLSIARIKEMKEELVKFREQLKPATEGNLISQVDQAILKLDEDIKNSEKTMSNERAWEILSSPLKYSTEDVNKAMKTLEDASKNAFAGMTVSVNGSTIGMVNLQKHIQGAKDKLDNFEKESKLPQMREQFSQIATMTDDALKKQTEYWRKMMLNASKGSAEYAEYADKFALSTAESNGRIEKRGKNMMGEITMNGLYTSKDDLNYRLNSMSAAQLKEYIDGLTEARGIMNATKDDYKDISEMIDMLKQRQEQLNASMVEWEEAAMELGKEGFKMADFKGSLHDLENYEKALQAKKKKLEINPVSEQAKAELDQVNRALHNIQGTMDKSANSTKKYGTLTEETYKKIKEAAIVAGQYGTKDIMKLFKDGAISVDDLRNAIARMKDETNEGFFGSGAEASFEVFQHGVEDATNTLHELTGEGEKNTGIMERWWSRLSVHVGTYMSWSAIWSKTKQWYSNLGALSESMTDVQRTTNMSMKSIRALTYSLQDLDTRAPQEELMKLATTAGQLGLKGTEDIRSFTEAADELTVTLDELGSEGVLALSKVAGLTGDEEAFGIGDALRKVGSSIKDLSSNTKASAKPISDFVGRLGGISSQVNISTADIAALGATLDANAQDIEKSATALTKFFVNLQGNSHEIAAQLQLEPKVLDSYLATGQSMQALLYILDGMKEKGMVTADVLKAFGSRGAQMAPIFGALSQHVDELRQNMELSNMSFLEGTSISEQYALKNQNAAAIMQRVGNTIEEHFIDPAWEQIFAGFAKGLKWIVDGFYNLRHRMESIVPLLDSIAIAFFLIKTKAIETTSALITETFAWIANIRGVQTATEGATSAWKRFGKALKANWVSLAISGIVMLIQYLHDYIKSSNDASDATGELTQKQIDMTAQCDRLFGKLRALKKGTDEYKDVISQINSQYVTYLGYQLSELDNMSQLAAARDLINAKIRQSIALKQEETDQQYIQDQYGEKISKNSQGFAKRIDELENMPEETKGAYIEFISGWVESEAATGQALDQDAFRTKFKNALDKKFKNNIYNKYISLDDYTKDLYNVLVERNVQESRLSRITKGRQQAATTAVAGASQQNITKALDSYFAAKKIYASATDNTAKRNAADELIRIGSNIVSMRTQYNDALDANTLKKVENFITLFKGKEAQLRKEAGRPVTSYGYVGTNIYDMDRDELLKFRDNLLQEWGRVATNNGAKQGADFQYYGRLFGQEFGQNDYAKAKEWTIKMRDESERIMKEQGWTKGGGWGSPDKNSSKSWEHKETDEALAELDRYYEERKTRIEAAMASEEITQEEGQRRLDNNEKQHLGNRAKLRGIFTNRFRTDFDAQEKKQAAEDEKFLKDWWATQVQNGDMMSVAWQKIFNEWSQAAEKDRRENDNKMQKDITEQQKIIFKHVQEIKKALIEGDPLANATENFRKNLDTLDLLYSQFEDDSARTAELAAKRLDILRGFSARITAMNYAEFNEQLKATQMFAGYSEDEYKLLYERLLDYRDQYDEAARKQAKKELKLLENRVGSGQWYADELTRYKTYLTELEGKGKKETEVYRQVAKAIEMLELRQNRLDASGKRVSYFDRQKAALEDYQRMVKREEAIKSAGVNSGVQLGQAKLRASRQEFNMAMEAYQIRVKAADEGMMEIVQKLDAAEARLQMVQDDADKAREVMIEMEKLYSDLTARKVYNEELIGKTYEEMLEKQRAMAEAEAEIIAERTNNIKEWQEGFNSAIQKYAMADMEAYNAKAFELTELRAKKALGLVSDTTKERMLIIKSSGEWEERWMTQEEQIRTQIQLDAQNKRNEAIQEGLRQMAENISKGLRDAMMRTMEMKKQEKEEEERQAVIRNVQQNSLGLQMDAERQYSSFLKSELEARLGYYDEFFAGIHRGAVGTGNVNVSVNNAGELQKFATGGFVKGDSTHGDKIHIRVNAGEAVLTPSQQKTFMELANGVIGFDSNDAQHLMAELHSNMMEISMVIADFNQRAPWSLPYSYPQTWNRASSQQDSEPIYYSHVNDLPDVQVTPTSLVLSTYDIGNDEWFKITGHSSLNTYHAQIGDNLSNIARIDAGTFNGYTKSSSDYDYNLVSENCSDATRRAIEFLTKKKINPWFMTTPWDVRDYVREQFADYAEREVKPGYSQISIGISHYDAQKLMRFKKWINKPGVKLNDNNVIEVSNLYDELMDKYPIMNDKAFEQLFHDMWDDPRDSLIRIIEGIKPFAPLPDNINDALKKLYELQSGSSSGNQTQKFAKGKVGLVGPGTETSDSIPAMLSKGESVITAEGTKKNREILEAINRGEEFEVIKRKYAGGNVPGGKQNGIWTTVTNNQELVEAINKLDKTVKENTEATRTITGKVVDENGEAMMGAHVTYKDAEGKTQGVAADVNGYFKIDVPESVNALDVSYLGKKKSIDIKGNTLNVVIDSTSLDNVLSEVVVKPTQQKPAKTGAMSTQPAAMVAGSSWGEMFRDAFMNMNMDMMIYDAFANSTASSDKGWVADFFAPLGDKEAWKAVGLATAQSISNATLSVLVQKGQEWLKSLEEVMPSKEAGASNRQRKAANRVQYEALDQKTAERKAVRKDAEAKVDAAKRGYGESSQEYKAAKDALLKAQVAEDWAAEYRKQYEVLTKKNDAEMLKQRNAYKSLSEAYGKVTDKTTDDAKTLKSKMDDAKKAYDDALKKSQAPADADEVTKATGEAMNKKYDGKKYSDGTDAFKFDANKYDAEKKRIQESRDRSDELAGDKGKLYDAIKKLTGTDLNDKQVQAALNTEATTKSLEETLTSVVEDGKVKVSVSKDTEGPADEGADTSSPTPSETPSGNTAEETEAPELHRADMTEEELAAEQEKANKYLEIWRAAYLAKEAAAIQAVEKSMDADKDLSIETKALMKDETNAQKKELQKQQLAEQAKAAGTQMLNEATAQGSIALGEAVTQASGSQMLGQLTAGLAQAGANALISIADSSGKTMGQMGWWGAIFIPVITSLIMGLLGSATSKAKKAQSQIASATGNSSAGKLSTGMLTYAVGRYANDGDNLSPDDNWGAYLKGHSYNVHGNDGVDYDAVFEGRGMATGIRRDEHFGIFSEKKPEMVIDGDTTQTLVSKYPGLYNSILDIANGKDPMLDLNYDYIMKQMKTIDLARTMSSHNMAKGMPTFAAGSYPYGSLNENDNLNGNLGLNGAGDALGGMLGGQGGNNELAETLLEVLMDLRDNGVQSNISMRTLDKKQQRMDRWKKRNGLK